jgi:PAS domain S-box-containing protein
MFAKQFFCTLVKKIVMVPDKHSDDKNTPLPAHLAEGAFYQFREGTLTDANDAVMALWQGEEITQRIKAEEELRLAENRFRALIENAPDGIALVSVEGSFKYVSPSAKKMFSYQEDDSILVNPNDLTHPDDLPMVLENLVKLMTDPSFVPVLQYRFMSRDGSWRWIESTFTNMLAEPSIGAIVINFRDINDRKIAEDEITLLNQTLEKRVELRTAELLAANKELEAFAYSVSHDLRAPVRAIGGYTKILEEEYFQHLDAEGQRLFGVILENTRKMDQLIDDLLSFSRLSRADMTLSPVNMDVIVRSCYTEITGNVPPPQISLTIKELPVVLGDQHMLVQVWANLLSNAVKYTRHCENPQIEISCERDANDDIFIIKDNGIGFDMKYAHNLFGVFQRLHSLRQYEGTGVGLAIVQRIVQRHGGRIWAEAEPGKGAKFYFTIPCHAK